jgi:predicted DNA-binding transcriptional regulator AlpA
MAVTKRRAGIQPKALRILDAIDYSGLSRSGIYREAAAGKLTLVKLGSRTLVTVESLDAYIASLPAACVGSARKLAA